MAEYIEGKDVKECGKNLRVVSQGRLKKRVGQGNVKVVRRELDGGARSQSSYQE